MQEIHLFKSQIVIHLKHKWYNIHSLLNMKDELGYRPTLLRFFILKISEACSSRGQQSEIYQSTYVNL
ncbi:hypothetical protein Hanom_Chr14g01274261 [Helianthus anomalus]